MRMRNGARTEEEFTLQFKTDINNLTILIQALKNLKNLHFNGLPLTNVYNVWTKKSIEELCLMALKTDAKFEGKMTSAF